MPRDYVFAFWNVENLFDVADSPRREERIRSRIARELVGWDEAVLSRKLAQLAAIIPALGGGRGPDVLGVAEVENAHVLGRLAAALGPGRDYGIVHAEGQDGRGIDVALLYDRTLFTVNREEIFSRFIVRRSATRDILQATLTTVAGGNAIVVLVNHWPSRSGGAHESEPYRIMAGESLSYFHQRILEEKGRDAAILAMGDFNDEPFNRSLQDYALATRARSKATHPQSQSFYNPMWRFLGSAGSYVYDGEPNVLDQILVSRGLLRRGAPLTLREETLAIEALPALRTAKGGGRKFGRPSEPKSYNPDGYADHFPVSVTVSEA
ncbi:endonuclease/exonuclease/phosphatase family protein [Rhodocista pekingensis]|uniref:Endonuclease/exonuclease/phosphatase family protein n=1 Tax=Rhodocista pekingensis TaxID=201185 RepID=A0ABW2KPM0_9PROT